MSLTHNSESVEYLVEKNEVDMADASHDPSPTCWMFDCLTAEKVQEKKESYAHKRASRRIGVQRDMQLTYQQPHLVEPMKLTVYDQMPLTPLPSQQPSRVSMFASQSRKSISRASTRASLAVRRRTQSRPSISKPHLLVPADVCQLRRNPSFRPLQLSIYMADKRLSDLPEFDAVSFTEDGEIKMPPRAVIRTQSEELLRTRSPILSEPVLAKPASMFEQTFSRRMSHMRQNTESTLLSVSRPSSAYDALHSHPVSWYSVPGIAPVMQFATAPNKSKIALTPMQEEFTPPPSGAVIINGKVLAFPNIDAHRISSEMTHSSLLPPAPGQETQSSAPSPVVDPGPNRRTTVVAQHKLKHSEAASILLASSNQSTRTRAVSLEHGQSSTELQSEPRPYFHTDFKTNNRINQWLDSDSKDTKGRSRESSVSTIKTSTTTSSFAEHRRKRSQFYELNQKPEAAAATPATGANGPVSTTATKLTKTPTPLTLYKPFPPQKPTQAKTDTHIQSRSSMSLKSHARTQTTSTVASSVATDVLFEKPETPELESEDQFASAQALPSQVVRRAYDNESVTTVDMKSRTGTMKSTITDGPDAGRVPIFLEKETNPASEIISVTKGDGFVFRGMTPSPETPSPRTPLSARAQDVEKMMFEMCAQGGYRRVNVGVAF